MSKRINQYDSLDFERKVLYLTGVYCGRKFPNNAAFKIYRIVNTSTAFLFLFLMAAKMIVERDNLELVFDVLHTFISQITLIIKAIYLCKVLPKYNALEERLTEPIFNQQTPDQDALISENILGYKYAAFTLHGLAWVALVLYTICPIIEGPILAIPFWLPSGLDNYKMFVKIYEVLCTWTLSSGDPALDLLPVCLLSIGTAQLDILNQNLTCSADRDPDDSYEVQEKKIRVRLKNCVQHHLAIIKYLDDVQDIFSFGMFIQIFTSVVAICMTGLQFISITPDSTVFFQVVTYFGCMLSQIYNVCWIGQKVITKSDEIRDACYMSAWETCMLSQIYNVCWIGQKVITKSDEIRDACYMSAWETCCSSNKKTIFIFMERSKRVMMFRAGNFFTLSLATFVLIIRNAYSYFAVLVRVYK
uniref:Odorant receptor n=1 Tax=Protaetia brevitarsis TaxID=348688 RepID=A0A411HR68_PROBE|nr:odorant receptor [Protaetia brevitarsis]